MPTSKGCRSRRFNQNVPRHKGKFVRFKPVTPVSQVKEARIKFNEAHKLLMQNKFFDKFASLLFLKGHDEDWLPISKSTGPLVTLAEELFRPCYLLSRENRSYKINVLFAGGDPSKVVPIETRFTTKDPAAPPGTDPSRIKVFFGRRLPLLQNYSTEIAPVRELLEEVYWTGALKPASVDEAFTICLKKINSYVVFGGKRAYIGYPKPRLTAKSRSRVVEDSNGPCQTDLAEQRSTQQSGDVPTNDETEHVPQGEGGPNELTEDANFVDDEVRDLEDDDEKMEVLFAMAKPDTTYRIFSLLFDETVDNKLDVASGLILRQHRGRKEEMDPLLKEVLLYAHWKSHKIKDPVAHEERERKLRVISESLHLLRSCYDLPVFSEMRHQFE